MDASFVDLDILLTRIREPKSKVYFFEAVKSYKAGALRSAISAVWVSVVYDLIAKYRELDALGDAAASDFIKRWDNATEHNDSSKLLKLEGEIIDDATTNTQIIDRLAASHLLRIRNDRHLCAHPAFSSEAELFAPSPELARLHLVNAIEFVLAQEPLQGKAILKQFNADVQSTGFPLSRNKVLDYVEGRYLTRIRSSNTKNFGVVLAKSLLKGVPEEWEEHRSKVSSSLMAVRERGNADWSEIADHISRLIDSLEPGYRLRAVSFLSEFPDFWGMLDPATQTALVETVDNISPERFEEFSVLRAVRLPVFRDSIKELIDNLPSEKLASALSVESLIELWPRALHIYADSGSFRRSESNFQELIMPFSGKLTTMQLDELLKAIADNGQNWDASQTPLLFARFLQNTSGVDYPSHDARDEFYRHLRSQHRAVGRFSAALDLLQADGWTLPEEED